MSETRPVGRPKIEITPELCEAAKNHAMKGLAQYQIASVLGMGEKTFYEKIKEYPQFLQAVQEGQAEGIQKVSNALFDKATGGDVPAQKYYLNNRDNANWKERQTVDTNTTLRLTDLTDDELDRKLEQLRAENEQNV